jgi:hypothetical protein
MQLYCDSLELCDPVDSGAQSLRHHTVHPAALLMRCMVICIDQVNVKVNLPLSSNYDTQRTPVLRVMNSGITSCCPSLLWVLLKLTGRSVPSLHGPTAAALCWFCLGSTQIGHGAPSPYISLLALLATVVHRRYDHAYSFLCSCSVGSSRVCV